MINKYDKLFEERKHFRVPDIDRNFVNEKDYYTKDFKNAKTFYNGKIYYLRAASMVFVKSEIDDEDRHIYTSPTDYFYSIHVDDNGIYIYTVENDTCFKLVHLDFDGNEITKIKKSYRSGEIQNIYIYNNVVYYSLYNRDKEKSKILSLNIKYNEICELFTKVSSVDKILVKNNKLYFKGNFINEKVEYYIAKSGWMIIDVITRESECLSNPYCSLENVISKPSYYIENKKAYNEKTEYDRNIVSVDLQRDVYWCQVEVRFFDEVNKRNRSKYYLIPKELTGDREKIKEYYPIWKLEKSFLQNTKRREYFDGINYYCAEEYYLFYAYTVDGEKYNWTKFNGGHGECQEFQVLGDYIYINLDAVQPEPKKYMLSVEPVEISN